MHPAFHACWLQVVLVCADSPLWTLAPAGSPRPDSTSVASGSGAALRAGEAKLPASPAGARHAWHAPLNSGRSPDRVAALRLLWTPDHRLQCSERVHLPVRPGVAALARRPWATSPQAPQLLAHLEGWHAYSHCVRPHQALQVALMQPRERGGTRLAQRSRQRTEALVAGRTNRRWTAREVLSCPLPSVSA